MYAALHLSVYVFWYFYDGVEINFIKSIFSNTFLTTVYIIPSLVVFERLIPKIIELCIESSGEKHHTIAFRQIKI
jgi:hypothetical protein